MKTKGFTRFNLNNTTCSPEFGGNKVDITKRKQKVTK